MTSTETKLIRVGHSPDPDDAFMFYALAKEKIPMRGFKVQHVIEDIESLNQRALQAELEVTAVSCHAYAYLSDHYAVMRAGSSIGDKYGPILVAKHKNQKVKGARVAVPGKLTTAYLVLQLFEKDIVPVFTPFDEIFEAVKSGKADVGLVIHEGQITYKDYKLEKLADLGEWWDGKTKLPLPLGIDVIRRDLGPETMASFAKLFKESIQYALSHRKPALDYAIRYGRGIAEDLNDRFVGMYVNDYTVEMGEKGEAGFRLLLEEAFKKGIIPHAAKIDFIG